MKDDRKTLLELEKKFWQSLVSEDTATALGMLTEPAYMVGPHGTMKFDHATYRRMAEQGTMTVKSYEIREIDAAFPAVDTAILTYEVEQVLSPRGKNEEIRQRMTDTSTWVRVEGQWKCVMHTEAPAAGR